MARLIGGVFAFDITLCFVGYCLLTSTLRGRPALSWLTFAGLAFLLGAAAVGVALSGLAVAGLTTGPAVLGPTAAALAVVGLLGAWLLPAAWRARVAFPQPPTGRSTSRVAAVAATVGAYAVAAICGLMIFASFRSSPWLDDSWTFWLPKGIALDHIGLDARAFGDNSYVQFTSPDYPLWWSIITGGTVRFVGSVDLRAIDAQLGILVAAFFAAAARLLWGHVRSWILWPLLLLLAASPELLHQSQSGGADLPLAIYLALSVLAGVGWVTRPSYFFLALLTVFAAAAASIKVEGVPQLIIFVALPATLISRRATGSARAVYAAVAAAFVLSSPWFVWTRAHGIPGEFSLVRAIEPTYLLDRTGRAGPSAHELASQLSSIRQWLLAIPGLLLVTVAAAFVERRLFVLAPAISLGAAYLFWIWIYWAGAIDLDFWLRTSAYRVVDSLILVAGVSTLVLAELIVRRLEPRQPSADLVTLVHASE